MFLSAREKGQPQRFFVQDLPAGKPRQIGKKSFGYAGQPVSPDGQRIAAFGEWAEDLFLVPMGEGEPSTIPNSKKLDPIRWSPDGKSILAVEIGSIPARIVRVDVATGRREPWKDLGPPDLSGVVGISRVLITPDGKSYVYGYSSSATSDLYIVDGLK